MLLKRYVEPALLSPSTPHPKPHHPDRQIKWPHTSPVFSIDQCVFSSNTLWSLWIRGACRITQLFHQTWVWVWIHFHLLVCFSSIRSCFTQFKSIAFCGSNHCVDLGWPHINVECRQRLVAHPHWAGSLPPTPHHCALSFAFGWCPKIHPSLQSIAWMYWFSYRDCPQKGCPI